MSQVAVQTERWTLNGRAVDLVEVLRRAVQHHGAVERVSRRQWWARSDRDPWTWYPVVLEGTEARCGCPAGQSGKACKHASRVLVEAYGLR